MLTKRTFLLLFSGLLTGYLAAAQTTDAPSPAAAAANASMVNWILGAALCTVGLLAILAVISVLTVAASRRSQAAQEPAPNGAAATLAQESAATW
jgi:heme/copper-type cytochrome/quinol oxidase subunit 2